MSEHLKEIIKQHPCFASLSEMEQTRIVYKANLSWLSLCERLLKVNEQRVYSVVDGQRMSERFKAIYKDVLKSCVTICSTSE